MASPSPGSWQQSVGFPRELRHNLVICGAPATAARKLLEVREEIGDFGHLLLTGHVNRAIGAPRHAAGAA